MAKGTVAKNNAIKAEKTNQVKEAEPKTNEKASDVLQAAKNAAQDVKTAVKESASEVKAAVTEKTAAVKEAVEEKAAAKAETVKDTAAETKETAKPAREKKPSRAAKKAAKAAKEELKPEVFIQYQGNEAIVADGLDLQIVIKACYLLDLLIVSALEISLNDLATLAGTTEDKTLTVSYKLRFWYSRTSFEIFKIGV